MATVDKQKYIAGLGGVFIYADNPKELAAWYTRVLGLEFESDTETGAFYLSFYYWDQNDAKKKRLAAWSIMKREAPKVNEGRQFQVNYRVNNMDELAAHIKKEGVEMEGPNDYPGEGKFAWIIDPEGNKVELWEDGFEI